VQPVSFITHYLTHPKYILTGISANKRQTIIEKIGAIDILVNNAGIGIYGKVIDQTIEDIEKVTSTNYLGMIYFTKSFLPSMIKNKRGHIVNVASLAASFGVPCMAAYCGSKFAMLGFSVVIIMLMIIIVIIVNYRSKNYVQFDI